jgi:phenylalanyl-tRNA synthetase beta chain
VCEVEVARGDVRQIVCASAHPLEAGWGVPVALAGTELPTGDSIHEEHFHGVLSQGMICLDGELGMTVPLLAGSTGLQVFRDEALLGKSLPEAMPITEALVHMKVYPNRPDCLGLIGIARELAALLGLELKLPAAPQPANLSEAAVPVEILDASLCSRYTCQVISGIRVEKSPAWLASRLLATGSRPINNVVDITNFVLKEWGHPLHAFDLDRVREKVVVRRFQKGESLRLLDGRTITASGGDSDFAITDHAPLGVCDAFTPMALAGIMGGESSGIAEDTVDVLLEAAHFEPTNIRLTSRRLGVSSDSSYRFERGLDPNETLEAARNRATTLLFTEASAKSAGPVTDVYPKPPKRAVFSLPAKKVSGYLGIPVTREQVLSSLTKLGYECSEDLRRIKVPTRRVDATDPVVLIEDVARVIGYEAITATPSSEIPTAGGTTDLDAARSTARGVLTGNGFLELRGVPLEPLGGDESFSQLQGESIALTNPLNSDLARLRRSLVPFLLNTAERNAKRRATTFRHFEIDKIFSRPPDSAGPEEHWALGLLLGGAANDADWSTRREADFFDLKGIVESMLEALRIPHASYAPVGVPGYLDGAAAQISVEGHAIGIIGQVSPELLAARKIQTALFAAELFLGKLIPLVQSIARYEPLPRFPGVFRDLSFVVKKDVAYAAIEQAIRSAAGPYLESVDCIDVFAGKGIAAKGIPKDSRSMAVSMAFRAPHRTLSSDEVTASVDQVIESLSKTFGAELRSR